MKVRSAWVATVHQRLATPAQGSLRPGDHNVPTSMPLQVSTIGIGKSLSG